MLANLGTTATKALRRSVPTAPVRVACRTIAILVPRPPESIRDYVWQDLELSLERLVHTMIVVDCLAAPWLSRGQRPNAVKTSVLAIGGRIGTLPFGEVDSHIEAAMRKKPFNRELAKDNPKRFFDLPQQIVDETLLTRGEKIATRQSMAPNHPRGVECIRRRNADAGSFFR